MIDCLQVVEQLPDEQWVAGGVADTKCPHGAARGYLIDVITAVGGPYSVAGLVVVAVTSKS